MNKSQILLLIGLLAIIWVAYVLTQMVEMVEESPLMEQVDPSNGLKNGEVRQHTSDGRLKTIINYKDGVKHGMSYMYHEDGETILLALPYEEGNREGTSKKYHTNGKLYAETQYHQDELHGVRTVYYRSGNVKSTVPYWMGLPGVGTKEYLKDGTEKNLGQISYQREGNFLILKTNPECKNAMFYIGELIEDEYFDPYSAKLRVLPRDQNWLYYLDLNVYTPSFLKYQHIICSCESSQGNDVILKKEIVL